MFISSRRNVILPSRDFSKKFKVQAGYVGEIPDWATQTAYFKALVADGKILVPESTKDKHVQEALDTPDKFHTGAGAEDENDIKSGLEKMTVAELKEFADERKIELPTDLKKAEIVDFISDIVADEESE